MKTCITPKNPKMCDPILVTLLKMRPHYSQSGHENANPIQWHISIILASYNLLFLLSTPEVCRYMYIDSCSNDVV